MTPPITFRRRALAVSDPLAHAFVAGVVVAPLVPRFGRGPLLTALAAGTLIDVDHALAARSLRVGSMISLATRPRTHTLLSALAVGAVGGAAGGSVYGWAAFAGLASHLLRDAGDSAAPTPLLWPLAPPAQVGRRRARAGIATLALGSLLVSRAAGGASSPAAAAARGAGEGARLRTA